MFYSNRIDRIEIGLASNNCRSSLRKQKRLLQEEKQKFMQERIAAAYTIEVGIMIEVGGGSML
jgi:phosphoenolpyruvate-protein kinase (PTS system EI component)